MLMLHQLQDARKRGVPIITFNPLKERGLQRFTNPQSPTEMLSGDSTRISTQYHQVKAAGDLAALMGLCKAVIEADDRAQAEGRARVLDIDFIAIHTHGFEAFAAAARGYEWSELERQSANAKSVRKNPHPSPSLDSDPVDLGTSSSPTLDPIGSKPTPGA